MLLCIHKKFINLCYYVFIMDKREKIENEELKKEEDYRFVKQVIKKKTVKPEQILVKAGCIIGGAFLFGIIAAFVFVQFLDVFKKEERPASEINLEEAPDDVEIEVEVPTPTPEAPDLSTSESGKADQKEESLIAMYNAMYDEMQKVAQSAMSYMVTVTGINSDEDWFAVLDDSSKQASGIIIAQNESAFYVLTEYDAVDTVERVVVTFCDNTMADGRYQMHDPNTGLTILKVDKHTVTVETRGKIQVASLGNSTRISQGDAVIAIGCPMGYRNSVVYGQITSTTNMISTWDKQYNLLTTNMLGSNEGNGVLINLDGNVIGIVVQNLGLDNYENVIVGLPISQLKETIEMLSNGEPLPCLGIKGQAVTDEVANQTGMPKGIYVSAVKSNSPAFDAGIRNGDIITFFEGEEVHTMPQYTEQLYGINAGAIADLKIMRKGTEGYREFDFKVVSTTW